MPGSFGHLTRRFFEVLTARGLSEEEMTLVVSTLDESLARVFFRQSDADQRHGYQAGMVVLELGGDSDEMVAALMHDVGKRHSALGIIGRSVASVLVKLGLPLTQRMIAYRDHGPAAAHELARLGAPQVAIDFAMHHHAGRPESLDADTWRLLQKADQPKAAKTLKARISSRSR